MLTDAKTILQSLEPIEREIEARSGAWYIRAYRHTAPSQRTVENHRNAIIDEDRLEITPGVGAIGDGR